LNWIAQIFGTLAICCSLIIYSRNDRKKLLIFKCIQDICWGTHYLLLATYPPAATSALCICRSLAFYGRPKEEKKSKWILILFLALYALSACLTWKDMFSILPAISSSISTVAFWMKKTRHTKILAIFASLCTLSYNIAVAHSVSVYIGVTITMVTSLISLLTSEKRKAS
jgi:hypothetical protein